ncbi:MAG: metal-sulfur cluster assembly factor [Gemmatimonadota bacterium]|nr:metal-sulfur cluster assembly factor [Gemmatimonadota bacterium]MDH5805110.1 metal-sulfur cluster assembly factor [Gemmatimonadota bacterium]
MTEDTSSEEQTPEAAEPEELNADLVKKTLRKVKDPEVGLNIIDLGLVYEVTVTEGEVHVQMTLTSPGCPVGPEILGEADSVVRKLDGVTNVEVELVWEPFWTPERIDPRVRSFLGH